MPIYVKILSSCLAFLFFIIFFILIRKHSIKPFYSFLWFVVSLSMFSMVVCERLYKWIAVSLGLTDASFLVTTMVIFFLLIYVLHLSIKVSEMSDRIQELISFTSILDNDIRKIYRNDR
jgi:hypothetical protein